MNESRKPTLAAIEAALSDYNTTPSVDPTTDELSDDVKPFWTILQQSARRYRRFKSARPDCLEKGGAPEPRWTLVSTFISEFPCR